MVNATRRCLKTPARVWRARCLEVHRGTCRLSAAVGGDVSTEPSMSSATPVPRSLVRIKALVLGSIFAACAIVLRFVPEWHPLLLVGIAALAGVLHNFVRCEQCHSSIYYQGGGRRVFFAGRSAYRFLYSNQCPYCQRKRL